MGAELDLLAKIAAVVKPSDAEWDTISKSLYMYASALTRKRPDIFDGVSAEDLVMEAIEIYLESDTSLGWDPTLCTLERFLGSGVLKKIFFHHVRRGKRYAGSIDDFQLLAERREFDQFRLESQSLAANSRGKSSTVMERARAATRGDKELEELVDVIPKLENEDVSRINQSLAKLLNATVKNTENRRRRITRRLNASGRAQPTSSTKMGGPDHAT